MKRYVYSFFVLIILSFFSCGPLLAGGPESETDDEEQMITVSVHQFPFSPLVKKVIPGATPHKLRRKACKRLEKMRKGKYFNGRHKADVTDRRLVSEERALAPVKKYLLDHQMDLYALVKDPAVTPLDPGRLTRKIMSDLLKIGLENHFSRAVTFEGRWVIQADSLLDLTPENMALMRQGNAPLGPDGRSIRLHHIAQHDQYPLMEVTYTAHRGSEMGLHAKSSQEWVQYAPEDADRIEKWREPVDRQAFATYKTQYWRERVKALQRCKRLF